MSSARGQIEEFANKRGIELIYIPQSDGCELSLSYYLAVSFSAYQSKRRDVLELIQIAERDYESIRVLGPTIQDLGLNLSLFATDKYVEHLLKIYQVPSEFQKKFKNDLESYVFLKMHEICNHHLKQFSESNLAEGASFGDNWVDGSDFRLKTKRSPEWLADNPAKLREIAQQIKTSIPLIEQYFLIPNNELTQDMQELVYPYTKSKEYLEKMEQRIKLWKERNSTRWLLDVPIEPQEEQDNKSPHPESQTCKITTSKGGIFGSSNNEITQEDTQVREIYTTDTRRSNP
jgi:hypothetical protein